MISCGNQVISVATAVPARRSFLSQHISADDAETFADAKFWEEHFDGIVLVRPVRLRDARTPDASFCFGVYAGMVMAARSWPVMVGSMLQLVAIGY